MTGNACVHHPAPDDDSSGFKYWIHCYPTNLLNCFPSKKPK